MSIDFTKANLAYRNEFNENLQAYTDRWHTRPSLLAESMQYSLYPGGKRVRPVLLLSVADLCGVPHENVMNFAIAMEMIHTYSLIHDDLPDMDNDDYRRGKLSNHKVFGNANAILAGDALLNTAYSLLFEECLKGRNYVEAAKYLCDCAGIGGMVAGQSFDLQQERSEHFSEQDLWYLDDHKTGKLLSAAVMIPSLIGGGNYVHSLQKFGLALGRLFQISDDLLDVVGDFSQLGKSIGKDEESGKLTAVSVYGVERARAEAIRWAEACRSALSEIDGDTSFLNEMVLALRDRVK